MSLSVAGTLSYITWTSNQTPNRVAMGEVALQIVENGAEITAETNSVNHGVGNKEVQIKSNDEPDRASEVIRVTFVPEIASVQTDTAGKSLGNAVIGENWSAVKTDTTLNLDYIETDVIRLYLVDGWSDNWTYKNGTFYYKTVLAKNTTTQSILSGVVLQSGVNLADYGTVKVAVIADAIQSTPAEAPAAWGCTVDDSGNVTVS